MICQKCRNQPPAFKALRSYCAYQGPARKAIHRLKYQRDIGIAEALAVLLTNLVRDLAWPVDTITAVPLSPSRTKQRGYNQASLLAIPLALALQKPFDHRLLTRTRETDSQVGLSMIDRKQNVAGAFSASDKAAGKVIWVIDDVITTGATMNACAQALMKAGAIAVYGLSFARALLGDDHVPSDPIL
jgi:ComF family protein